MKTMKNIFLMSVVASLSACMGTYFKWEQARRVQLGMTEHEVEEIMGHPMTAATRGDRDVWTYVYGTGWGTSGAVTYILKDGKVVEIPRIPASYK